MSQASMVQGDLDLTLRPAATDNPNTKLLTTKARAARKHAEIGSRGPSTSAISFGEAGTTQSIDDDDNLVPQQEHPADISRPEESFNTEQDLRISNVPSLPEAVKTCDKLIKRYNRAADERLVKLLAEASEQSAKAHSDDTRSKNKGRSSFRNFQSRPSNDFDSELVITQTFYPRDPKGKAVVSRIKVKATVLHSEASNVPEYKHYQTLEHNSIERNDAVLPSYPHTNMLESFSDATGAYERAQEKLEQRLRKRYHHGHPDIRQITIPRLVQMRQLAPTIERYLKRMRLPIEQLVNLLTFKDTPTLSSKDAEAAFEGRVGFPNGIDAQAKSLYRQCFNNEMNRIRFVLKPRHLLKVTDHSRKGAAYKQACERVLSEDLSLAAIVNRAVAMSTGCALWFWIVQLPSASVDHPLQSQADAFKARWELECLTCRSYVSRHCSCPGS